MPQRFPLNCRVATARNEYDGIYRFLSRHRQGHELSIGGYGMTAGDGASEQARLASERVLKLRRQLEQAERNERAWTAGAAGEVLVATRLNELTAGGWRILHDVHWPGRPKANLDHVLVGPGGVLVVDAKNWTGSVQIRGGVLFQNRYSRARETDGVLQQGAALTALLEPQHRNLVQTWLCLVGQPELQGVTANGVRIQGLNTLTAAVWALPDVLEPHMVETIHSYLRGLLTGTASPSVLTTAHLDGAVAAPKKAQQHRRPAVFSPRPNPSWNAGPRWRTSRPAPRKSSRRSKSPGYLGLLMRLVLLLVIAAVSMNLAQNHAAPASNVPNPPAPQITQTLPPR